MKNVAIGLAIVLVLGMSWGWAQDLKNEKALITADEPQSFDFWMTAKLEESQEIFAALAAADYQAIAESASTLKTLNEIEGFVRKRDPKYRTQLRAFEFAVEEIQRQAKKENIEGAVLGFNQLTLSCVNCHKQLRDAGGAVP